MGPIPIPFGYRGHTRLLNNGRREITKKEQEKGCNRMWMLDDEMRMIIYFWNQSNSDDENKAEFHDVPEDTRITEDE
ncbi:hypothetical protein TNCV_3492561 [Trichonephila clavipes]|nr:hypothetical protein TNCV_3492561 [Trichonephila clavipes]